MPEHEPLEFEACDICARTLLVGERSWRYVATSGDLRTVCTLCKPRAEASGWVPEVLAATSARPHQRPRGRRFGRVADVAARVRRGIAPPAPEASGDEMPQSGGYLTPSEPEPTLAAEETPEAPIATSARPDWIDDESPPPPVILTDAEVVEEALRVFNASDEQRQVGGLRRTLGTPQVSVRHAEDGRDAALIVIAWDLSWYEWEVDLGDGQATVTEVRKGSEVSELGEPSPEWNAALDDGDQVMLAPA